MELKNKFETIIVRLDKEKLIYKKFLSTKIIKRNEIRSVFYNDTTLGILTYNGEIHSINIQVLLEEDINKLEELRLELNKENIIFDYTNFSNKIMKFPLLILQYSFIINIFSIISNKISDNTVDYYNIIPTASLAVGIIIYYILIKRLILNTTVYNIEKNEVEIFKSKGVIKYNRNEIDKVDILNLNERINTVVFYKGRRKYRIKFTDNKYVMKIYNTSLNELLV